MTVFRAGLPGGYRGIASGSPRISARLYVCLRSFLTFPSADFSSICRDQEETTDAPMWAPPFPPEEFDDYDDEAGMETQVSTPELPD